MDVSESTLAMHARELGKESQPRSESPERRGLPEVHLGYLDGIRGAAALYVLLTHCMIWGGWYKIPLPNPKLAVDVFMILSGYLMVHQFHLRSASEPIGSFQTHLKFWLRRYFRIAPLYYFMLVLVFVTHERLVRNILLLRLAFPDNWDDDELYDPGSIAYSPENILLHLTFLFGFFPQYALSTTLPDWSIGLEMQFYLVFPLLYLGLRKFHYFYPALALLFLSLIFEKFAARMPGIHPGLKGLFPEPSFLLYKLPVFLIGMLVCETVLRGTDSRERPFDPVVVPFLSLIFLTSTPQRLVLAALCCLLLLLGPGGETSRLKTVVRQALGGKVARISADLSYSVYLVHGVFIALYGGMIYQWQALAGYSVFAKFCLLTLLVLVSSYGLAYFTYHLIEKPGIHLGQFLIKTMFRKG